MLKEFNYELYKEKVLGYIELFKSFLEDKLKIDFNGGGGGNKKDLIVFLILFLFLLVGIILSIKNYVLMIENKNLDKTISQIQETIKTLNNNDTNLILLPTINKIVDKTTIKENLIYNIKKYLETKQNENLNRLKIINYINGKGNDISITIKGIIKYNFVDDFLIFLKQFNNNIIVNKINWEVDKKADIFSYKIMFNLSIY